MNIPADSRELIDNVKRIWNPSVFPDGTYWAEVEDVEVAVRDHGRELHITLSAPYEAPGLNIHTLIPLGKYLGTMNINERDQLNRGGCDTCDYGSRHGYTLVCRPQSEIEPQEGLA